MEVNSRTYHHCKGGHSEQYNLGTWGCFKYFLEKALYFAVMNSEWCLCHLSWTPIFLVLLRHCSIGFLKIVNMVIDVILIWLFYVQHDVLLVTMWNLGTTLFCITTGGWYFISWKNLFLVFEIKLLQLLVDLVLLQWMINVCEFTFLQSAWTHMIQEIKSRTIQRQIPWCSFVWMSFISSMCVLLAPSCKILTVGCYVGTIGMKFCLLCDLPKMLMEHMCPWLQGVNWFIYYL